MSPTSSIRPGIESDAPAPRPERRDGSCCARSSREADTLWIGVGNPYFWPGRTQLELRTDGGLSAVTFGRFGTERSEGRVDRLRAAPLVDEWHHAVAVYVRTARMAPEPDEPLYQVELRAAERPVARLIRPRRQLLVSPPLCCLLTELRTLSTELWEERHPL
jgi:hypothetical protein